MATTLLRETAPKGSVDKYVKTLRQRFSFSEQEERELVSRMDGTEFFSAGDTLVEQEQAINYSRLLYEGFACREKIDAEGERQIAELLLPGDFIDLHSYPLERLDHSITALTDCKIVKLNHKQIDDLIDKHPRFARLLWFSTMTDASIHREWINNLGSRSGSKRMAHLLCETYCRMEVVGLLEDDRFPFPLTQKDLGETLGFTPIHVNRMVKKLRDLDLADIRRGTVWVKDFDGLAEHAGFDPAYLYLTPRDG